MMPYYNDVYAFFLAVACELRHHHRLFVWLFIIILFGVTAYGLIRAPRYVAEAIVSNPSISVQHGDENRLLKHAQDVIYNADFLSGFDEYVSGISQDDLQQHITMSRLGATELRLRFSAEDKETSINVLSTITSSLVSRGANDKNIPPAYAELRQQREHFRFKLEEAQKKISKIDDAKTISNKKMIAEKKMGINKKIDVISSAIEEAKNNLDAILVEIQSAQMKDDREHIAILENNIATEKRVIQSQRAELQQLQHALNNEYKKDILFSTDLATIENLESEYASNKKAYETLSREKTRLADLLGIDETETNDSFTLVQRPRVIQQPVFNKNALFLCAFLLAVIMPLLIASMLIKTSRNIRMPQELIDSVNANELPVAVLPHMHSAFSQNILKKEVIYLGLALLLFVTIITGQNTSIFN